MSILENEYSDSYEQINDPFFQTDLIRIDQLEEYPFVIPKEQKWLLTNSVSEYREGKQKWIGRVIGKNKQYIHFMDNTQRIWIFVGKKIERITRSDLILIHVNRDKERVKAEKIFLLQEI